MLKQFPTHHSSHPVIKENVAELKLSSDAGSEALEHLQCADFKEMQTSPNSESSDVREV